MLKNISVIICILMLCVVSSCATKKDSVFEFHNLHDYSVAPLIGVVFDMQNQPCPDVEVVIQSIYNEESEKTSSPYTVLTDVSGRFLIPNVVQGMNNITLSKEGFELGAIAFDYTDPTQVFYIQMISWEYLLDEAESAIEEKQLYEAFDFLSRAEKIKEETLEGLYLWAVYYNLAGNDEKAQESIDRIKALYPQFEF